MTNRVARIRDDANMMQAAEALALANSSDLMVVDAGGRFVGVLPEGDILRAALPNIEEILDAGGSLEAAFAHFVDKALGLSDVPISKLVIRDAISLDPDDHVAKAAVVFIDMGIRVLPVVRDERLLGSLYRADICAVLVGGLPAVNAR